MKAKRKVRSPRALWSVIWTGKDGSLFKEGPYKTRKEALDKARRCYEQEPWLRQLRCYTIGGASMDLRLVHTWELTAPLSEPAKRKYKTPKQVVLTSVELNELVGV